MAIAFLLCLAASALATGQDTADEADFRFRRGADLYQRGRFDDALVEFFESNRLVPNRNVQFNIARCLEQLEMYNEAYRYYGEILAQSPPEGDRRAALEAQARLRPNVALLRIESEPPGATIYLERRDLGPRGTTPKELALPPGPAAVILELAGYRPATSSARAEVGSAAALVLTLERIYGTVETAGSPAGAALRLDRPEADPWASLGESQRAIPGRHTIFVQAAGYTPQRYDVEVPADGHVRLEVKLVPLPPPTGAIVVRANLDGALITLDGKPAGFTPAVVADVPVGEHEVAVSAEGREPVTARVAVTAGERPFVDVHLRYAQPRIAAATKSLTRSEDAPASISVITGEEIRAFGYQTLAEALRAQRGIFVTSDRIYDYLGFRGFYPPGDYNNRVLILVDGHPFNDLWVGQGYDDRTFDVELSDVERIELVRGPGSALYGSNALFGVVNVVHRPPAGSKLAVGGRAGTLSGQSGGVSLAAGTEDAGISVRAAALGGAGEPVFVAPDGRTAAGLDAEWAAHADLRARLGGFSLAAAFSHREKAAPTAPYGSKFGGQARAADGRGFFEGRYEGLLGPALVSARLSYDASRYRGAYEYQEPPSLDENGGADWFTAEVRSRFELGDRNTLALGVELQEQLSVYQWASTTYADGVTPAIAPPQAPDTPHCFPTSACTARSGSYTQRVGSLFLTDSWTLASWARLDLGGRLDSDLQGARGLQASPRLALILRPYAGATTKLLAGRAFRAPSFYERFYGDGVTQLPAEGPGSKRPKLVPEAIWSFEVEHTHPLTEELILASAVFFNDIARQIQLADAGDGQNQVYANAPGDTRAVGWEVELRYQPTRALLLGAAAWYQRSTTGALRIPSPPLVGAGSDPEELANSPRTGAALRAMWPLVPEILTASSELVYGGPRRTGDAAIPLAGEALLWNVGLAGEQPVWGLSYGVWVANLLDERYAHPRGSGEPWATVPQHGRELRLAVAWSTSL